MLRPHLLDKSPEIFDIAAQRGTECALSAYFLSYAVMLEHFNQQVLVSYHIDFDLLWTASINGGRAVLLFYVRLCWL